MCNAPTRNIVEALIAKGSEVNLVGKDGFNVMERYLTYADTVDPEIVDALMLSGFNVKLLKHEDQLTIQQVRDRHNKAINTQKTTQFNRSLTRTPTIKNSPPLQK